MNDKRLKVFCTIVETKSFSRTSEIIRLSQPAVSLSVQTLEEMYGTRLFNRSGCLITLTRAGEMLYKYARVINNLYSDMEKDIGRLSGLTKGTILLGASSTIGNYVMPPVVAEFKRKFPQVRIYLHIGNTMNVVEYLNSGIVHLGLVEGEVDKKELVVKKLIPDEMVIIMPPDHHLAKKSGISIKEISKEPLILREKGSGTRQIIEKFFNRHGISPEQMKTSFTMGSTESIKHAVEVGLGISIISRWAVKNESQYGCLKSVALKDDSYVRNFSMLFRKSDVHSHTLDSFIGFLKQYPFDKQLNS